MSTMVTVTLVESSGASLFAAAHHVDLRISSQDFTTPSGRPALPLLASKPSLLTASSFQTGRKLPPAQTLRPVLFTRKRRRWQAARNELLAERPLSQSTRSAGGLALEEAPPVDSVKQLLTVVMKFGGSSVATAERMREVAKLVLSFPQENPIIVMSAMGKTTNLLLAAGENATTCGVKKAPEIEELWRITDLHNRTCDELGIPRETVAELLEELSQLLTGISLMKELTLRTKDYLVSFGERMSTRIFAAYLNRIGTLARQYDAFDLGFVTTDDFTNGEILDITYPAVREKLEDDFRERPAMPIVTGFLARGEKTGATTTLGRGGSDLTATVIGKALRLREVQVWKDVDGVLTTDPRLVERAVPVPFLTYEEATELAYFGAQVLHPQSMRPTREAGIPVRVKNSYNPTAPGTLITAQRDMSKALLTSIVCKRNVTMLDIVSTRMLGQYGFLAKLFQIFEELQISVDVVATSEVSVSITLDPAKMWSRELIKQEVDRMTESLRSVAHVKVLPRRAILSLIGNVQRSSLILEKVFRVFRTTCTNVQMISQGASKVNISLVVDDEEAHTCVKALHQEFFEQDYDALVEGDTRCED